MLSVFKAERSFGKQSNLYKINMQGLLIGEASDWKWQATKTVTNNPTEQLSLLHLSRYNCRLGKWAQIWLENQHLLKNINGLIMSSSAPIVSISCHIFSEIYPLNCDSWYIHLPGESNYTYSKTFNICTT